MPAPGDDLDSELDELDELDFDPVFRHKKQKSSKGKWIVLGLLVLGGVGAGGWYFMNQQGDQDVASVPVVRADSKPVKVRPEKPGGMTVPNQDKLVYDRLGDPAGDSSQVERLLPPPEEPQEPPMEEMAEETPKPMPETMPAPTKEAAGSETPEMTAENGPMKLDPPKMDAAKEMVEKTMEEPKSPFPLKTVGDVPKPPKMAEAPKKVEPPKMEAPVTVKKLPEPKVAPKPLPLKKVVEAPKPVEPAPMPKKVVPPMPKAGGKYKLQLASVKDEGRAKAEWTRLLKKNNDLLGKLSMDIQRADLGQKGIFYRLRADGFPDKAEAANVCKALKARKVGCLVVSK